MALLHKKSQMERREFLKGLAGAVAMTASGVAFSRGRGLSVGIVGAGIMGSSIAYYLAKSGAQVTILEKNAPASGATEKSFGLLSVDPVKSGGNHYDNLRFRSMLEYKYLETLLDLDITWGGTIHSTSLSNVVSHLKSQFVDDSRGTNYASYMINDAQFSRLANDIEIERFKGAVYSALDGHIDPVRATGEFLKYALAYNAKLVSNCRVNRLLFAKNKFVGVTTSQGEFAFDRLVIASGVDTPFLSSQAGFVPPLRHSPGLLAHSVTTELITQPVKIVSCATEDNWVAFKQYSDGRIVASESHGPPNIPAHQAIRTSYVDMPESIRAMHGNRIFQKLGRVLPQSQGLALDKVTLGLRPLPSDELPIAGFVPNNPDVYVAVMHFGVTLAPLMGRYISQEVLTGKLVDDLSPYRPNRFLI